MRHALLVRIFAVFLVGCSVATGNRPNIVVIIVDDLGYGDLASYGAKDLRTPHIDSLMANGMRFDSFYANCPVCSPTRAALLSGRYQELVGVPGVVRTHAPNNWGYLAQDAVMLPQLLKPLGYHSAIIGKWHLGLEEENQPTRRGFDFFHGFLGDMMDDYYHHRRHGNHYMRRNEEPVYPKGHATDIFSQWAVNYLAERAQKKTPFFLYLSYNAPHTPIQPPTDWFEKVKKREAGISSQRAKLVALIEHMDEGIGNVMKELQRTGLWKETLVFFVSDNGGQANVGANNGALRGEKQEMYEGGLRVPACAVWPGKIKPGGRSGLIAATMDIFPTVVEAAGSKVEHAIDGRSFLPLLLGKEQPAFDRDLFFTRREGGDRFMGECIWAMRRGDWKLVKNSPMKNWELFDLSEDPGETTDLAGKNRGKYRELGAAMRVHIQRGGAIPWQKRK
ncbi:MAG: N-acetylgalactosamine 6-sulfate sulfatase [Roseibacillus sp.]|nr:N-acetylgalactosamine 6-sulfate sulfatase [Roseibacillus sp.]|tara:strand:- start:2687 stop:4030 length:1344 start_codon:yes stop_codon:yes gene_type:complete